MLTCIAVDDEPLALRVVRGYIEKTPYLTLAGAYTNALEALEAVRAQPVDLLFLDIQMPELSGLDLARALREQPGGAGRTRVVFTTAFTDYALDGYKVDALDYLLKPFGHPDFLRVALKAQAYFKLLRPATALPEPAPEEGAATAPLAVSLDDSLILKVEYQLVRVRFADILYIEGLKDYVRLHRVGAPALLSLSSLRALEEKLPAGQFLRLHRSFIVNLHHVDAVTRGSVQIGKEMIPVSAQYREAFEVFLRQWS